MVERSSKRTLVGAALAFAMLGFATQAEAFQCKTSVESATFQSGSQANGLAGARSAWTNKVRSEHGLPWSIWAIAQTPQESCQKVHIGFRCQAAAKPCLYVVP